MKRNMLACMDKLKIDRNIRDLVRQLWKHCYEISDSCWGHGSQAYVLFLKGDGWFENNANQYNLAKVENGACCSQEFEEEVFLYGFDPQKVVDCRKVCGCGAGVNGYSVYRGKLVQNPFR